jgi:hypothetical protein
MYEDFLYNEFGENYDILFELAENINYQNRFHCVCHRLDLTEKDALDSPALKDVRKKVFKTIAPFARSHLATAELLKVSGKKLLFPATTRWSTINITYARVFDLKSHINVISAQHNWPLLMPDTLIAIENIILITNDVSKFMTNLQADNRPTISLVYPGITNIINNLQVSFILTFE